MIYYELSEPAVNHGLLIKIQGSGRYYMTDSYNMQNRNHFYLMMHSDRIWSESTDNVVFIKNRYKHQTKLTADELKEFVWIKLKSIYYV